MFDFFKSWQRIVGFITMLFGGASGGVWWLEWLTPDVIAVIDSAIMAVIGAITTLMGKVPAKKS